MNPAYPVFEKGQLQGRPQMRGDARIQASSGNVFADLNLRSADNLSIQAELTRLIYLRIKQFGLIQSQAAERLGLRQPDVSKLMNGRHTGYSTERLICLLIALTDVFIWE